MALFRRNVDPIRAKLRAIEGHVKEMPPAQAAHYLDFMRSFGTLSWTDYQRLYEKFAFQGIQYILPSGSVAKMTALQGQRDPVVAACTAVRMSIFSEISFALQPYPKRGQLVVSPRLAILQRPSTTVPTTQALLSIMESDNSYYGNSYWWVHNGEMTRLEPIRVRIISTDVVDDVTGNAVGKEIVGYAYMDKTGHDVAIFQPSEIVHFKPQVDPEEPLRGQAWITPILPDISADIDMTTYKTSFLRNSATPNLVVTFHEGVPPETIDKFRDRLEAFHTSPEAAFKTLYVGGGADVKAVGANFSDMSFAAVQAQGETRIAAAAGVPASLVGIAEGLRGSTLNEGNFTSSRRAFADGKMRPNWRSVCGALSGTAVNVPANMRLWYDDTDVPFLQLDGQDAAQIRQTDAATMLQLINGGYEPNSVKQCVLEGSWVNLKHTGALSVQLQPIDDEGGFPSASSAPAPMPGAPTPPAPQEGDANE